MGIKTLNEFFYKLAYGAKGLTEANSFNDALDVADAEIKANKDVRHTQNTDTDLDATFEASFAKKADKLSVFAPTTSAELAGVISDEVGTGKFALYEEGTWTPAYTSTGATFTYSNQNGTYVKIGKIVFITFILATTAVGGTTSNAVTITGLPFTAANQGGIAFGVSNIAYIPMGNIYTTEITLRRQNTLTQLVAVDLAGEGQFLVGSGFYSI